MISTLSTVCNLQTSSRMDRQSSKQRFIDLELYRSSDSRRRRRVLSSAHQGRSSVPVSRCIDLVIDGHPWSTLAAITRDLVIEDGIINDWYDRILLATVNRRSWR